MRYLSFLLFAMVPYFLSSQIVYLSPVSVGSDDAVTLYFDASKGGQELIAEEVVYIHHGVVTDAPDGTDWRYVIGNWGLDDGIGRMTRVDGEDHLWQINLTPSIRQYFDVPEDEDIYRIATVFRSADGQKKASMPAGDYDSYVVTANGDIYISLQTDGYVILSAPSTEIGYYRPGDTVQISAQSSHIAVPMTLSIDEGSGPQEVSSISGTDVLTYDYIVTTDAHLDIVVTATLTNGALVSTQTTHQVVIADVQIMPLPDHVQPGINLHEDRSKVTLVLQAPGKRSVYAVGDFNDWTLGSDYLMHQTPDGIYHWITLDDLTPGRSYVYQYWIDGDIRVADPYTELVVDPYHDQFIPTSVYPDIPSYDHLEYGIASVLETDPQPYEWADSERSYQRPDLDHLVIYELHIRDFLQSHDLKDLKDTLSYLSRLGVDAIELMPINEFEGNDSWGYNPSFFFAVDKYYGSKDDLKAFIEAAHSHGMAVIMDIVLNHSFSQSPLLQMYFDTEHNRPAPDNPWYNEFYVGQYQWGYDFDHESPYTQELVDRINRYWLEEFHFDGFRFDFTKGFTNNAPGGSVDGFDQSRIDILKRMADQIRAVDPEAYIILEHWGTPREEEILTDYGMKIWRYRGHDFIPPTIGNPTGSFQDMDVLTHISYIDSHDEPRIAEQCLKQGVTTGTYRVRQVEIMLERVKMAAAFAFLMPGPKMLWQFDELGYDIDINFNGRVGKKPQVWGPGSLGYYDDLLRQHVYTCYKELLSIRHQISPKVLAAAEQQHQLSGDLRYLRYDTDDIDLILVGNFSTEKELGQPGFTHTGPWYNYFSGREIIISDLDTTIVLAPGEWRVYTSQNISDGHPGIVEAYDHPVTITPYPFTMSDQITITYDATKGSSGGTQGLIGAEKVYFHSGLITEDPDRDQWTSVVGTLMDDGTGQMTSLGSDLWQIQLTPMDYYPDTDEDIFQLAMYFRDGPAQNIGTGFRGSEIRFDIETEDPIVEVHPTSFRIDDAVTIIFDPRRGNRELIDTDKIYMHSGVVLSDTDQPGGDDWSHVIGQWGADDGLGLMHRREDGRFELAITPRTYYGLTDEDEVFWIASVFRNADGSQKGTTSPGDIQYGLVADNLDFFLKNQLTTTTWEVSTDELLVYPNPATDHLTISGLDHPYELMIYTVDGIRVRHLPLQHTGRIDIGDLDQGLYLYSIFEDRRRYVGRFVIIK